jgi:hypothetical protein
MGGGGFGGIGGAFGGGSATGFGASGLGMNTLGFLPFFGRTHRKPDPEDDKTPVDCDALVDHDNPGHRAAVQTISHVDDEKHDKILQWLKDELHKGS